MVDKGKRADDVTEWIGRSFHRDLISVLTQLLTYGGDCWGFPVVQGPLQKTRSLTDVPEDDDSNIK